MSTGLSSTCMPARYPVCQDIASKSWQWAFNARRILKNRPTDTLDTVTWTFASPLKKATGVAGPDEGVIDSTAYIWINVEDCTVGTR